MREKRHFHRFAKNAISGAQELKNVFFIIFLDIQRMTNNSLKFQKKSVGFKKSILTIFDTGRTLPRDHNVARAACADAFLYKGGLRDPYHDSREFKSRAYFGMETRSCGMADRRGGPY